MFGGSVRFFRSFVSSCGLVGSRWLCKLEVKRTVFTIYVSCVLCMCMCILCCAHPVHVCCILYPYLYLCLTIYLSILVQLSIYLFILASTDVHIHAHTYVYICICTVTLYPARSGRRTEEKETSIVLEPKTKLPGDR